MGNAWPLYQSIRTLTGLRELLETAAVWSTSRIAIDPVSKNHPVTAAVDELEDFVGPIRSAIFRDTADYKNTIVVGPAQLDDGSTVFVKAFKTAQQAAEEVRGADFVRAFAEPHFQVAKVIRVEGGLVLYEFIPRRGHSRVQEVAGLVSQMCGDAYELARSSEPVQPDWAKTALALAESDDELRTVARNLRVHCERGLRFPLVRAHGDCSPWNVLSLGAGRYCLIDYERANRLPPFADRFHFEVQPAALQGRVSSFRELVSHVAALANVPSETSAAWLGGYLIHQLSMDLFDYVVERRRYRRLRQAIETKASILDAVTQQTTRQA